MKRYAWSCVKKNGSIDNWILNSLSYTNEEAARRNDPNVRGEDGYVLVETDTHWTLVTPKYEDPDLHSGYYVASLDQSDSRRWVYAPQCENGAMNFIEYHTGCWRLRAELPEKIRVTNPYTE